MSNMTAVAGESISITCPVGGYPIDVIIWERGSNKQADFFSRKSETKQIVV